MRRLAWIFLASLVGGSFVPVGRARASAPTDGELERALEDAKAAVLAHKAGDFETAATKGKAALPVFAASLGWEDETTLLIGGITVDALEKLGRNDEADAVRAMRPQPAVTPRPTPPPQPEPEPAKEKTPQERANEQAGLALLAFIDGRYDVAAAAAEQAIAIQAQIDPNGATMQQFRSLLASLYLARLQYDEAESILTADLDAARRSGDDGRLHAALQEVADLQLVRGETGAAESNYQESLTVAGRLDEVDASSAAKASALQGLADVELARDKPAAAIPLLEQALQLQEQRTKVGTIHLLQPVRALGQAYELAGRFEESEKFLLRAQGIAERTYGQSGLGVWNVRTDLGRLYRSMKRYDEAIAIFEKMLVEQEAALPARSPALGGTLNHLAETLWAKGGQARRTVDLASRAAELQEHNIVQVISAGTEPQKRAYLQRYESGTDRIISYHVGSVPTDVRAARLSLNTILRRKGRVLDAVSDRLQAVRSRLSPTDAEALDRLREARGQIAALVLRGPDDNLPAPDHAAKLVALDKEVTELEKRLSSLVEVSTETELVEIGKVQALVPEDAALVEIALYRPFDVHYDTFATAFGAPRYVAYVVHARGEPQMVDLGEAAPIDDAVTALRKALAEPRSNPGTLARRLDELVMAKIRPKLGKSEHVLVSPDGQLNLVPFAAMLDDKNRYLVQSYEFTYLSSGRDLLRLAESSSPMRSPAVLVGAPEFSSASSGGGQASGRRSAEMSSQMFSPLPGTEQEVRAIGERLEGAQTWIGSAATESALKGVDSPVLLHVATHGFFLADQTTATEGTRGVTYNQGGSLSPPPEQENPLIRSGLALTGANVRAAPDGEDGILTALEVAGLDLSGTELAVLSACETGVGDVANGEGVYGLRRALVIAGARSQVISLWQVDDEASRDLMVRYYKKLRRGKGRSEALRDTQLRMLGKRETSHPFYWAAFIPSGDWEPVDLEHEEPRPKPSFGGRRGGGSGELKRYWREKFDDPMIFVSGGYSAPITGESFEGAAATNSASFDLQTRFYNRPWTSFGLDYGRHPWKVPDSARQLEIAINRLELVLALDVLPMPYSWRVRPGVHPYLGLGLAWGYERRLPGDPPMTDVDRERRLMGGIGMTFGTNGALYVRLTEKMALSLFGGVAKPIYRLRAGGDRLDYDDEFPRAWRWQAGLGIGGLPG